MPSYVLTLRCHDQPGIVHALTAGLRIRTQARMAAVLAQAAGPGRLETMVQQNPPIGAPALAEAAARCADEVAELARLVSGQ